MMAYIYCALLSSDGSSSLEQPANLPAPGGRSQSLLAEGLHRIGDIGFAALGIDPEVIGAYSLPIVLAIPLASI